MFYFNLIRNLQIDEDVGEIYQDENNEAAILIRTDENGTMIVVSYVNLALKLSSHGSIFLQQLSLCKNTKKKDAKTIIQKKN